MNSATRLWRVSPSSAILHALLSRGGILGFLEWTADSGELLQRRSGGIQIQIHRCLRSSYHGVWSKGIHPRHPPREFPLDPLEEKVKKKRWTFSTHRRKEIAGIFWQQQ